MKTSLSHPALSLLVAALVLAGCSTAPEVPKPELNVPQSYKESAEVQAAAERGQWKLAQPAEGQDRGAWWTAFGDAQLNELEQQAAQASPTLAAAAARVKAARATVRGSEADRIPQVNLNAGVTRTKLSAADAGVPEGTNVSPATISRANLSASYEVDLFGRVSNNIDAAKADAQATEATYRSVLLALQADVAQTYYQLRTLDAGVDILDRTVALRQDTLQLTEKRFASGDLGELDVARARTDVETAKAEATALRGDRARTEHALALLLGQNPSAYSFKPAPLPLDATVPYVPAGLPSSLLERRPDVAAAQAQMMAATARVGLARSAMFPDLSLTATGGYAALGLSDLFKWSTRYWLASALLSMPIIDGGRNRANVSRAESALEENVANYRSSVLSAFGDVEDKLSNLSSVRGQTEALDRAVVSARRAYELADKRYRAGEDSYLTLIDTQRQLLNIELKAMQLRGAWAVSTVGLIRSLGGGWETAAAAPANTPATATPVTTIEAAPKAVQVSLN